VILISVVRAAAFLALLKMDAAFIKNNKKRVLIKPEYTQTPAGLVSRVSPLQGEMRSVFKLRTT
jgi:hypothetical protein